MFFFSFCTRASHVSFNFANTFFILKDKPAAPKKGAELFDNEKEEDEELFSSKPKGIKQFAAPVKAKPSSNLFGDSTEDDLFSAPSQSPPGKSKHTLLFVKIIVLDNSIVMNQSELRSRTG